MLESLVNNDLFAAVVAFALILIPAVIIHELGHFLAAKAVGITVLEFGIGFPPRITRLFSWGETEFTLNWLPIGGFVRPLGEDMIRPVSNEAMERDREKLLANSQSAIGEPAALDAQDEQPSVRRTMSVNEAKPLPRIFFMAAGALANFMAAFILFVAIGLIGIPQDVGGRVRLLQVAANSALGQAGLQVDDLIEDLNGQKFTDSREFFGQLKALEGDSVTLTVRRFTTDDASDLGTLLDIPFTPTSEVAGGSRTGFVRVLGVAKDSPGDVAGLLADDLIIAFNGQSITSADDPGLELRQRTADHAGERVLLTVLRDDQEIEITLVPRLDPPPGEGRMGIAIWAEFQNTDSGFVYTDGPQQQMMVPLALGDALQFGVERTTSVFSLIAQVPARILTNSITADEARPVSIVGISQWGGQVLQQSIQEDRPITILNYIAMINILLGVTNLLPIPALDGGRIVFVLLEMVRGRPITPEREGMVHLIGLAFLLALGMLVILNDIINPLPSIVP
jgi:regulator of sigma E protease